MPRLIIRFLSLIVFFIILLLLISFIASKLFNRKVSQEVMEINNIDSSSQNLVKEEDIKTLPIPVQKWLKASQVVGKPQIQTVHLTQTAKLRTKPGASWMSADVEQYFTVHDPAFIWKVSMSAAPFLKIVGRDKYYQGKGHMLIKLLSFITVADAKGKEIDQGTLLRFLAESVWFPSAALSNFITWEEIDESSAKATMSYNGVTASGVFTFNANGDVTGFTAQRYMESQGKYSLETWCVVMHATKEFNGIRIPYKGELIWKLKSGDFKWYEFEIKDIDYNAKF